MKKLLRTTLGYKVASGVMAAIMFASVGIVSVFAEGYSNLEERFGVVYGQPAEALDLESDLVVDLGLSQEELEAMLVFGEHEDTIVSVVALEENIMEQELSRPITPRMMPTREPRPTEISLDEVASFYAASLDEAISPLAGNTTANTALHLPASQLNRRNSVTLDRAGRWFFFDVTTSNTKISANLEFTGNEAHDLVLYRFDNGVLNQVAETMNFPFHQLPQNLGYVAATPGTYFLWIYPAEVTRTITSTFGVFVEPGRTVSGFRSIDQFEPNDNHLQATRVPVNFRYNRISFDNPHDEDWFVFEADSRFRYHNVVLMNEMFHHWNVGNAIRLEIRPAFEWGGMLHSEPGLVSPQTTQSNPHFRGFPHHDNPNRLTRGVQLTGGELYAVRLVPEQWNRSALQGPYVLRISSHNGVTNFADIANWFAIDTTVQDHWINRLGPNHYVANVDFVQRGYSLVTGERYYIRITGWNTTASTLAEAQSRIQTQLNMGFRRFGTPIIRVTIR